MSRIKCILNLKKDNEIIYDKLPTKGIKIDDRIIYKENDINVTIYNFNNTIKMKRSTSEYIIELNFMNGKATVGTYYLIDYQKSIDLNIDTFKLIVINNKLSLDYNLKMNEELIGHFNFSLEYEVE